MPRRPIFTHFKPPSDLLLSLSFLLLSLSFPLYLVNPILLISLLSLFPVLVSLYLLLILSYPYLLHIAYTRTFNNFIHLMRRPQRKNNMRPHIRRRSQLLSFSIICKRQLSTFIVHNVLRWQKNLCPKMHIILQLLLSITMLQKMPAFIVFGHSPLGINLLIFTINLSMNQILSYHFSGIQWQARTINHTKLWISYGLVHHRLYYKSLF